MTLSLTKRICGLLIKKGLVTEDILNSARKACSEKGGNLSDVLISMKAVSRQDLLAALSQELGFPPINLAYFKVEDGVIDLIPEKIATLYKVIPISRIGNLLTIAVADPLNIVALDDLKVITNLEISPVIASEEDIQASIRKYYERPADEEISRIVDEIETARMETVVSGEEEVSSSDLLRITEEAPVVKLANMILAKGIKERAGDILIEPMQDRMRVRYRIDGVLAESYSPPRRFHQAVISRIKVLSELDITERRLPQDGRFQAKIEGRKVDFRVSVVPSSYGEKAALRVLDKSQAMTDLDALGFKQGDIDTVREAGRKPHGMILICGPTGCGKTTTLYSILDYVDSPGKNLVTVEDPVEYEIPGINQVSIIEDIGLTFAACLRSILRQDPDVIMVGEIRDYQTLDIAIKSALTGHLVLSTLHTNTASGAIVRMANMGVEPFLITSSVELIAAQRLLRKLCPDCKEAHDLPEETARRYGLFGEGGDIPVSRVYRPVGCRRCRNSGYRGRIGIIECMVLTPALKDLIFSGGREFEIELAARKEGMTTLRQNGIENVIEGVTSLEEVLRATVETSQTEK